MPDDVGGPPYPADGEGPESRDRGAADEAFAAVVFDDAFVEAARIHEPSARERLLYTGWDPEADPGDGGDPPRTLLGGYRGGGPADPAGFDASGRPPSGTRPGARPGGVGAPTTRGAGSSPAAGARRTPAAVPGRSPGGRAAGRHNGSGPLAPAGRAGRWQRPVACVLAMVMGLSVVAFALIAVQRAGSTQRVDRPLTPPVSDPGEDDAELLKSGETARTTGTADLPAAGPDAPAPSDALAPSDAPGPPGTSEPGPDAAPATDGRA
ncbi:hypothetical protein, partial [Streptomyces bohaiensis]|uniref:SCO2584 family spore wall biosynthesis protein n=1 Tax=Streptomyces bohaiensis TaxID=1431344 RepID=UPI0030C6A733